MTQGELEQIPLPFQRHMEGMEQRIMSDLVGRLKVNMEITSTADWEINRLHQLGLSNAYIKQQIQDVLAFSQKDIEWLFSDAVEKEYIRNRDIYMKTGTEFIAFEKNKELQELLEAVREQTYGEIRNLTQSMGFAIKGTGGKVIQTPLMDFYRETLDAAVVDISAGIFSYDEVIKRAVWIMTNSGLRSIDYDSGWSNRVDVAAKRAVMSGFGQVQAKINEQTARKLHTDYYEVSRHAGARPEHQIWQGKVYTYRELVSVCGLGSVAGLLGANCYHQYNAYIPGISVRTYTDEQLEKMNAEENILKEYRGKGYTSYEALQRQRKMEALMRKQRQGIRLLQEGGGNPDDIIAAKSRYHSTMAQYVDFSAAMKLPQQKQRVYQDGIKIYSVKGNRKNGSRLKETTDKWSKKARKELLQDEKALAARQKETAVIYAPDGRFLFQKRGDRKEVVFTKKEIMRMKNGVISHNHPTGGSFSTEDIYLFKESGAVEIRAATADGVYFMKRPAVWPVEIDVKEKIQAARNEIAIEVKAKYGKLYKEGKISATERFRMASDELNRKFAERYGFVYGKATYED